MELIVGHIPFFLCRLSNFQGFSSCFITLGFLSVGANATGTSGWSTNILEFNEWLGSLSLKEKENEWTESLRKSLHSGAAVYCASIPLNCSLSTQEMSPAYSVVIR